MNTRQSKQMALMRPVLSPHGECYAKLHLKTPQFNDRNIRGPVARVWTVCVIVYWKHLVTFIETKISLCWWRQYIFYLCGAPVKALADIDSPKWRQFLFFANLASTQPVTLWHTKGKPHWLKPVTNLYSTLYSPGVAGVRVTWTSKIQSEILCNCKNDFFSFFFRFPPKCLKICELVKTTDMLLYVWRNRSNLAA